MVPVCVCATPHKQRGTFARSCEVRSALSVYSKGPNGGYEAGLAYAAAHPDIRGLHAAMGLYPWDTMHAHAAESVGRASWA